MLTRPKKPKLLQAPALAVLEKEGQRARGTRSKVGLGLVTLQMLRELRGTAGLGAGSPRSASRRSGMNKAKGEKVTERNKTFPKAGGSVYSQPS